MNIIGIAIGITGLLLLAMFMWMFVLSVRKKRLEHERREREIAYRKAMEKNRKQERQERLLKAENGDVPSILFLAKEVERKKPKEALYWYTKAAKLDNVTGMYGVVRISNTMTTDLVLQEQSKFWQTCIAAQDGNLDSKFEMGVALFYGRGIDADQHKAIEVIESAANYNHVGALLFLGDWWISDNNPKPDPAFSFECFRKAAYLKSNEGRMKLGLSYLNGLGVKPNHEKGCYWIERAAEKGDVKAMYSAGEAWIDQRPSGNAIAYIWLFLACQLGYAPARLLRDKVAMNIGVDTVVGLQGLSKPMLRKINENRVGKHSIIKALNKLYKRNIPLEESEQPMEGDVDQVVAPEQVLENSNNLPDLEDKPDKLDFRQVY